MMHFSQKIFLVIILSFLVFIPIVKADNLEGQIINEEIAINEPIVVHFFEDRLCSVCAKQKDFMVSLQDQYPQMELHIHSISDLDIFHQLAAEYDLEDYRIMAPTTFVRGSFLQFHDFGEKQQKTLIKALNGEQIQEDCCLVRIPILNIEIDISNWSLPLIAVLLGSVDGLNVCSIGALILILSIVLIFESRRKTLFYGGLFILTTAVAYGLLVFSWGWVFEMLVGQLPIIRIIVGLATLAGGVYFFKEFLRFYRYGPTCQASENAWARRATERLKQSFDNPKKSFLILAPAVMFFALVITIVELPCSIGIPIAFTAILVESEVSLSSYIFYIILYLFFYLLIEIVIFLGAVLTKSIWLAGSKAITWVTLVGSLVLFYLAFHYLIGI